MKLCYAIVIVLGIGSLLIAATTISAPSCHTYQDAKGQLWDFSRTIQQPDNNSNILPLLFHDTYSFSLCGDLLCGNTQHTPVCGGPSSEDYGNSGDWTHRNWASISGMSSADCECLLWL